MNRHGQTPSFIAKYADLINPGPEFDSCMTRRVGLGESSTNMDCFN